MLGKDFLEAHRIFLDPFLVKLLCPTLASLLCGILMLAGSKWIISILTSLVGAILVAVSLRDPLALLAIPPLALGSFLVQIGVLRRLMPERRDDAEEDD